MFIIAEPGWVLPLIGNKQVLRHVQPSRLIATDFLTKALCLAGGYNIATNSNLTPGISFKTHSSHYVLNSPLDFHNLLT